jgi:hypothetical protein
VILPVKIFASVLPDSRRSRTRWPPTVRLYMNEVPPATIGRYANGLDGISACCPGSGGFWNGISLSAKSTVPWMYCERPSVEPVPA